MILWRIFDKIFKISVQTLKTIGSFVLISETGMFHYCFLDYSLMMFWRNIVENLISSTETFLIFIVFVVLTSESLMFLCYFTDDSLIYLWRTIDETTNIWMQTFLIIKFFNVLISKVWCFIAAGLINRCWWFFE